jgi:hypothetical protein
MKFAVDDSVTIRYERGTNIRGTIATADIPAKTIIMHITGSLVIRSTNPDDWCQSIEAVNEELGKVLLKSSEIPIRRSPQYHVLELLVYQSPQVAISLESLIGRRQPQPLLE